MPRHYRAPNKRIIHRGSGGRFRRSTLCDVGIDPRNVATGKMKCADCGHIWRPLVKTGICPECSSQQKAPIEPTGELADKLEQYRAIQEKYPMGIDPRDKEAQNIAQDLWTELRDEGVI